MANLWDGTNQRAVHANGAAPVVKTASETLNWANVNGGSNSLSAYYELDARAATVSIRVDANPGITHNGRKLKIAVNRDDTSSANFRGVIFTNGNPTERGSLVASNMYMLDRRAGHIVLEVVNGRVRINSGASFNDDPPMPSNADLLAILNSWSTGATWALVTGSTTEAFAQWNAAGVFNPARALTARILGIAGGGGAGGLDGGGGGAGEYRASTAFAITAASHAITIGPGGGGGAGWSGSTSGTGIKGGDTIFGALLTLNGGGLGGSHINLTAPGAGGSGGGAGEQNTNGLHGTGGASTLTGGGVGFAGAKASGQYNGANGGGGGGGGAGSAGEDAGATAGGDNNGGGGNGGAGLSNDITGVSVGFAGGGGGGCRLDHTGDAPGSGGNGTDFGGGRGGRTSATAIAYAAGDVVGATANTAAMSGKANSGGGGGGGGYNGGATGDPNIGGAGGSGVLILRATLVSAIGL